MGLPAVFEIGVKAE